MLIASLFAVPASLSLLFCCLRTPRSLGIANACGHALLLGVCALMAQRCAVDPAGRDLWGWLYVDALSVFFLLITAVVSFAAAVFSVGYIRAAATERSMPLRKVRAYYQLFNLFCTIMMLVPLLNNLAAVWIAVEMTTLASAFLVGFHNTKESVEAAWKYIILCSVGITFALLGIIFIYYTSSTHAGIRSLEWAKLFSGAPVFNPHIVKMALVFIFIGYGTKAGLAPMHNWLPDAHSQALSPVSGLLSGVLLKISLYAILRFVMLANPCVGYAFSARLFTLFGMISLAVAAVFILVQKDLKRLLAYSSVENIGLISLGFGFGPSGGVYAGLLHALNHAVTKAYMFFAAGSAARAYGTSSLRKVKGVIKVLPFTGCALLVGVFALVGMPPFSLFISKLAIIIAALRGGYVFPTALMLVFIAVAFSGLLNHISKAVFGSMPRTVSRQSEPASTRMSLVFLGTIMLVFGVILPAPVAQLLAECQKLVVGR